MEPSVRLTTKPAGPGDRIAHARLEADGALIFASDGHPKYPAKVGENISVALSGTDKALRAAEPQVKLMPDHRLGRHLCVLRVDGHGIVG